MIIDNLMITLGLDAKGVASGMKRAENTLQSGVKNIVGNILAPLAGAFAFGSMVDGYIKTADAVGKLSESIGVNVEDIQAWGEAAKRSGGSAEAFNGTMSSLSDKMAEFAMGSSSAAPVLAQLGISARKSTGEIKSSLDVMQDLAAASERYDSKTFKGIAKKLGIDDGTIKLLQQGSTAVDALVQKQKMLGVYTKEDAAIAAKAAGALADMVQVFKSVGAWAMRAVVPALTLITEKTVNLVSWLKTHETFVVAAIGAIAGVITAVLIPSIISLGAKMLMNPMTWIFMGIAAVVLLVAGLIDNLYTYIKGGDSALAGFWSKFGTGEEVAAKLGKAWETFKILLSAAFEFLKRQVGIVIDAVGNIITAVSAVGSYINGIIALFRSLFNLDFNGVVNALNSMGDAAGNIFGAIGNLILNLLDFIGIKEPILALWDSIASGFETAANKIKDIWSSVKEWFAEKINAVIGILPDFIKEKLGLTVSTECDPKSTHKLPSYTDLMAQAPSAPAITAAEAVPPSVVNNAGGTNITNDSKISVGAVNIQTQATDAKGIAAAIPNAINNSFNRDLVMAANTGVRQK